MKVKFEKIKLIYVETLLILLFVFQFLKSINILTMEFISNYIIIFGLFGSIIYISEKIILKEKIDIYDILIYALTFFGIIATIFAINPKVSLLGFNNRKEGLLIIVTYYILFLNFKSFNNDRYKSIILNTIIVLGLFHSIYAICQYFKISSIFGISVINDWYYSTGFAGNPNFLGTINILCLTLSMTMFFLKDKVKTSIIYGIFSSVFFISIVTSGTMSSVIAFVVYIVLLLVVIVLQKGKLISTVFKMVSLVLVFMLCFLKFNTIDNNYFLKQMNKTKNEISNVMAGNIEDSYGTGRIYIWKETLKKVPDNLLTGVGIDNFYYAFDGGLRDLKSNKLVDKAHNEYLQKLITEGIFSFITYIVLLFIILVNSFKILFSKDGKNNCYFVVLLLSTISYLVQAFFNISIIHIAPTFYILMGLLVSEIKEIKNEKN